MKRKTEGLIFAVISAAFGIYIILRAWTIPITVDESTTAVIHVQRTVLDTLTYSEEANPNNHILNTLLIKLLTGLFGWWPIVVRTPVLLGGFLYLWVSFLFSKKCSEQSWTRLFVFITLIGNPYLLEFFALARGYGLGAGLMMVALWQSWRFLEENEGKYMRNATIAAGLAVYSNFTLLLFFAPFMGLLLLSCWQLNPSLSKVWQRSKAAFTALAVFFALWYLPLSRLSKHPEMKFFTNIDTLVAAVSDSVKAAIHNYPYFGDDTVEIITWAIIVFAVCLWGVALWRWRNSGWKFSSDPRLFLVAVLPGAVLTNMVVVRLADTHYLQARLALFYYPLFALQVGIAASWLWEWRRKMAWALMIPVFLLSSVNVGRNVNLWIASEWWFDPGTYIVLDYLKKTYEEEHRTEPYSLDTHHVMQNSLDFHLTLDPRGYGRYAKLVQWHGLQEPKGDTDFYYAVSTNEVEKIMDRYEYVLWIPRGSFVLLRKKKTDAPSPQSR